ncbi:hypothetical protein [Tenacibaculum maritimum]|uniref:hypothetical protein n=1 Tax=Tenacibaculum maritimum TaxID=107401 RepID=UPI0012E58830|nr:hypothetical protein [Tenacibaculum maritimum]MCD9561996.1 hypothetical protein [Tenacibaculum maritimum]MCD9565080.1 hypothetical protein [Tenacibaculum maritimum]MCD9579053.1 hypothetical protein [Tenacibaculum maritimum]MCD9581753.1 hypothetical protein [Tenacibaculum maritimum]MCD9595907.1 hypothetical protein [Tenacibaculum maritimum]
MIKRSLIVFLMLTGATMFAQRNNSSPYSYFGIGADFKPKTVEQASMGGIGAALKDTHHLNFVNPASNADLRYATYGLGGGTSFLTLEETNASQTGNSTSLRYIALGFPIGKRAGLSVGLQPLSTVGYSLINEEKDTEGNVIASTKYTGTGGANRLYGSFGMYVAKGLSLGVEGGFIFGKIENNILNKKLDVAFGTKNEEATTIRGGRLKIGAQYDKELKNKLRLTFGTSIQFKNELRTSSTEKLSTVVVGAGGVDRDKKSIFSSSVGSIESPLEVIAGFGIGKTNKWYIGIDSEYQKAFETVDLNNERGTLFRYENSHRTAIGGYYIPKINSISSYWNRVTYRAGLRFEKTGLQINAGNGFTSIKDFGINVGLGLPLPKQLSNVNIGFEYGQKGTTNNNLIKENYFNVRLSLSLNSINWFNKRKID